MYRLIINKTRKLFCRFNSMFVDRLEVSLAELSMKYEDEKEHNRKLREKIIKVEKGRAIEKRRVKYYQSRHLEAKKP